MLTRIKGGRVVDPGNIDGVADVWIQDEKILRVVPQGQADENSEVSGAPDRVIDAGGMIVAPGLIDMHVHFREPGEEYKETIETGCAAAAAGGFTAVCTMPNTRPVNDCLQVTEFILEQAEKACGVRVHPVAAVSRNLEGKALCEYAELKRAGVVALSDDGRPVMSSLLMRRALEYAKGFGLLIISHCEDPDLAPAGVMNEGPVATRMGLQGIPNAVESIMVMRDIALAELTGGRLHIAHVSTQESVRAVREAKKRGVQVTAETAPHYFTLIDADVGAYNTHAKMNPPLRSEKDREAVIQGLADGTIDVIATDHAPHSSLEKDLEFDLAANGIIGLETSVPLSLKLVASGALSMSDLIRKMSKNPARILNLTREIRPGAIADLTIIDPNAAYRINAENFRSRSRNTPFDGWEAIGKPVFTIVAGEIVWRAEG